MLKSTRMRKKSFIVPVVIFTLLSFQSVHAFYGARPMGMGGAFTAIADDATAAYYNPAGMALNPGVDLMASSLINNRNQRIGDNFAAFKMNFEVEMNPFLWIFGIGAASLVAYSGSKYLSDEGYVKKGWSRPVKKSKKEESLAEEVKEEGTEKIKDTKQRAKQKAKELGEKAVKKTFETAAEIGSGILKSVGRPRRRRRRFYNPWFHHNYHRPSYWDYRHYEKPYSPQGKAQFAMGLSWVFDKNSILDQNTNWYSLTIASGYEERIALGTNINIYDMEIPSIKINGFGASIDAGLIARPVDKVAFGFAAKEMLTSDIRWDNGASTTYGMTANAGIALTPFKEVTIAADIHNVFEQNNEDSTTHFGIELRVMPGVAIRAGLHDESKTAGASLAIGPLILDYAYLGGAFNRTQIIGATWKL